MKHLKLLLTILLSASAFSKLIIPDPSIRVYLSPSTASSTVNYLTLNFQLPSGSSLTKGAFLGVDLSEVSGSPFASLTNTELGSSLVDSSGNAIQTEATKAENSIVFVKLTDDIIANKLDSTKRYSLTVTLKKPTSIPATFNNVGLFTCTSDAANYTVIDTNMTFALVSPFGDFSSQALNPLNITAVAMRVTAGSSTEENTANNTEPFIGDTFTTRITVQSRTQLRPDFEYIMTYDATHFDGPTGASSEVIPGTSTQSSQLPLQGNLGIKVLRPGFLQITGITETLLPGRQFLLVLSGWKAKNKPIAGSTINLSLGYKNTETLFSYSNFPNALSIKENTMEVSTFVSADSYPYIVSDMTWPMRVTVRPRLAVANAHVVVKTTFTTSIKYKFVAGTCEFPNSGTFGSTPVCHPFNSSTENGIHFYTASLSNTESFSFTVWIHILDCADFNVLAATNASSVLPIEVEIYDTLNTVPNMASKGTRIGYTSFTSDTACLQGNLSGAIDTRTSRDDSKLYTFNGAENADDKIFLQTWEFNSLQLYNNNTAVNADNIFFKFKGRVSGTVGTGIVSTTEVANRMYLNTASTFTSGTTFVNIVAQSIEGRDSADQNIPSLTVASQLSRGHYLEFIFRKKWFANGNSLVDTSVTDKKLIDTCFAAWDSAATGANLEYISPEITVNADDLTNFSPYDFVTKNLTTDENHNQSSYLYQGINGTLNLAASKLPFEGNSHAYYTIQGVTMTTNTANQIPYLLVNGATARFGIFTNCMTVQTVASSSLFDYFEFQAVYRYSRKSNVYTRLIRGFSAASTLGVFANATSINATVETGNILYYGVGSFSEKINVCLAHLPKEVFENGNGSSFIVFLYQVSLLDTDYTSYNNNYPVGNAAQSNGVFGFNSAVPLFAEDVRIVGKESAAGELCMHKSISSDKIENIVFGSQVWFTGLSSSKVSTETGAVANSIEIPVYCPEAPFGDNSQPTITLGWFDATNYNDVRLKSRVRIGDEIKTSADNHFIKADFAASQVNVDYKQTIFEAYGAATVSKVTKPYNSVYMFSSKVSFTTGSQPTFTGFTGGVSSDSSVPIFFMGNKYDYLYFVHRSTATKATDAADTFATGTPNTGATLAITNIVRPDLTTIVNTNGEVNLTNLVAISQTVYITTSTNAKGPSTLTNILQTGNTAISVLGLKESDGIDWTVAYTMEGDTFVQYTAFSAVIGSTQGTVIPANSRLSLTVLNGSTNTNCSIKNTDLKFLRSCSVGTNPAGQTGTTFTCITSENSATNTVMCNNMPINSNTVGISYLAVSFAQPSNIPSSRATFNFLGKANTVNKTDVTLTAASKASLTSINFEGSRNVNAFSTAILSVNLNRKLFPGHSIQITGDFSGLSIGSMIPNCQVSVENTAQYSNPEQGDELIENCIIQNFNNSTSTIQITTKKMLFAMGRNYKSNLSIRLWPVKVNKLENKSFRTNIALNNTQVAAGDEVAPTVSLDADSAAATEEPTSTENPFCTLSSVKPTLVGSRGSMLFTFNFTDIATKLTSTAVYNRLSVHLPFKHFGILGEEIECSGETLGNLDCHAEESSIYVNLKNSNVPMDANNKFALTIGNIVNTKIDANLSYLCSLDSLSVKNVPLAIATGTTASTLRVINNAVTKYGKFAYTYPKTVTQTINARTNSTVEINVNFDKASNHGFTFSGELLNKPSFTVEVPTIFPINRYAQTDLEMQIFQVNQDLTSSTFVEAAPVTIAKGKPTISGHSIKLFLNSNVENKPDSFNLSSSMLYFTIRLTNLSMPDEETVDTSYMNVIFTNESNDFLVRTYDNTINSYAKEIGTYSNGLPKFNRGPSAEFVKDKWQVDIYTHSSELNVITLASGFYTDVTVAVKQFAELENRTGQFSIEFSADALNFKYKEPLSVLTSEDSKVFGVGIPCGVNPGEYEAKVEVTIPDGQSTKVVAVKAVRVKVVFKQETISWRIPDSNVAFGMAGKVEAVVKNAFEDVTATLTYTSTIEGVTVNVASTSTNKFDLVASTSATEDQSVTAEFETSTNSVCHPAGAAGAAKGSISVGFTTVAVEPLVETALDDFTFQTNTDDASLRHDQIKFNFNVPVHTTTSCAVICSKQSVTPSRTDMLNNTNITTSSGLQYFNHVVYGNTGLQSVIVSGLRKNTTYNVNCFLTRKTASSESNVTKNRTTLIRTAKTEAESVKLDNPATSKCLMFNTNIALSTAEQDRIIDLCQNTFSNGGNSNNGCMICSDFRETEHSTGFARDIDVCRQPSLVEQKQEVVQDGTNNYSICAVQSPVCTTQLTNDRVTSIFSSFRSKVDTSAKLQSVIASSARRLLNQAVTLNSVREISDSAVPELTVCAADAQKTESCYDWKKVKFTAYGEFEIDVTFYGDYTCVYAFMQNQAEVPTQQNILDYKAEHSGRIETTSGQTMKLKNQSKLEPFVRGNKYNLYFNCSSRRVLKPLENNTRVNTVYEEDFKTIAKDCPRPELDVNPNEDDGCTCKVQINSRIQIIPQGEKGKNCSASFYAVTVLLALIAILI